MNYESDSDDSDHEFKSDWLSPFCYFPKVISEIVDLDDNRKLYLTDVVAVNDIDLIRKYNIKGIISLGGFEEQNQYKVHDGIIYYHIYVDDHYDDEIEIYFNDTTKFIDSIDGHVLIHCWAGIICFGTLKCSKSFFTT